MAKRTINKDIVDSINKFIKEIKKKYNVTAIILFGSYAKGTEHEDSDIDIAIITNDIENDVFDEELKLMKLRRNIDKRIEPHLIRIDDYKKAETPFIKEVIDTGIKVA